MNDTTILYKAIERENAVLSFENNKFKERIISIKKDGKFMHISNLYNRAVLLEVFRELEKIDAFKYLLLKHDLRESFGLTFGKNLFEELINESHLHNDDVRIIVNDMDKLIKFTSRGEDPGRLSKTIEGKLKEFRISLSNSREIRIFYFDKSRKIVFLNGFLKKTEKTPRNEIDKAKILMSKLE